MSAARSYKDTVGIFGKNFTQLLRGARITNLNVSEPARLMEHPLESGALTTDHIIILPVRIEVSAIMQAEDYKNTYRELKQLFLNATLVSLQCRSSVYTNQIVAEMPHEEDPSMFDALTVAIRFKQVIFASSKFEIIPLKPQDSNIVERGQVQNQTGPAANTLAGKIAA